MELFSLFDFIFPLGDPVLAQMYGSPRRFTS